jgi:hypothetical protein
VHSRTKTKAGSDESDSAIRSQREWLTNAVNAVEIGGSDGFGIEDFYPYTEFNTDTVQYILAGNKCKYTFVFRFGESGLGFYKDADMDKEKEEAATVQSHDLPLFIPYSVVSENKETTEPLPMPLELDGYKRCILDYGYALDKLFFQEDFRDSDSFRDFMDTYGGKNVVISLRGWRLIKDPSGNEDALASRSELVFAWLKKAVYLNKSQVTIGEVDALKTAVQETIDAQVDAHVKKILDKMSVQ